jgi:hypothetical protein
MNGLLFKIYLVIGRLLVFISPNKVLKYNELCLECPIGKDFDKIWSIITFNETHTQLCWNQTKISNAKKLQFDYDCTSANLCLFNFQDIYSMRFECSDGQNHTDFDVEVYGNSFFPISNVFSLRFCIE